MSEVISFRVDENNPREKLALKILKQRINQGFSIRQIIIDSLVSSEERTEPAESGNEMKAIMNSIERLANLFSKAFVTQTQQNVPIENQEEMELPNSFLSSIKSVIKPGIQL